MSLELIRHLPNGVPMSLKHACLTLVVCAAASGASADVVNLNTGAPGSGWTVQQTSGSSNTGGPLNATSAAVALTGTLPLAVNLPGFEAFAWANPFGGAAWVGQLATDGQFSNGASITCGSPCGALAGDYLYTTSFAAQAGGSLALTGFTADNGVRSLSVTQGATTLYSCTFGGPGTLCAGTQSTVTAGTGTLLFSAGSDVTIAASVQNLDGPGRNPSGFILAGNAQVTAVPEAGTAAMWVAGLIGLAGVLRRRARPQPVR